MRVFRIIAAVGLAAAASVANAALVTQWLYTVTSSFDTATTCFQTSTGPSCGLVPPPGATNTSSTLAWGTGGPSGQSSLVISNSPMSNTAVNPLFTCVGLGCIPSGNQIGVTNTFTHNNFPVDFPILTSVSVITTLTLQPLVPPHGAFPTFPPLTLPILFKETDNIAGSCAVIPSPPNPCPDIFVIVGGLNNFTFFYNETTNTLSPIALPGFDKYIVSIFPLTGPLAPLDPGYCAAVLAPPGCIGFITQEGLSTVQTFGIAITTEPIRFGVPEPGMLALFALGLVGLGYTIRRRQA